MRIADDPDALWRLLVLTILLSRRIRASVAVATAGELFAQGWTSPARMRAAARGPLVAALGRGGYRRYDFSTATRLQAAAATVRARWDDDLRRMRDAADGEPARIAALVQEFDGIGPAGARIFLREVQAVWPQVRPVFDDLAFAGARAAGLPEDPAALAACVAPGELADLAAALVRVGRDPGLLDDV